MGYDETRSKRGPAASESRVAANRVARACARFVRTSANPANNSAVFRLSVSSLQQTQQG